MYRGRVQSSGGRAAWLHSDDEPDYLMSLLSRGTNAASRAGEIGQRLVDGFDREAHRRVANGSFYGAMLFLSLSARKDGA